MTAKQLRDTYTAANPNSPFFAKATMRHWGDTMANYGCRAVLVQAYNGPEVTLLDTIYGTPMPELFPAYELFRRRPVKHGNQHSAIFTRNGLKLIHNVRYVVQERGGPWRPSHGVSAKDRTQLPRAIGKRKSQAEDVGDGQQ